MTEQQIKQHIKFTGCSESYNRYKEYTDKLYSIKNKIFNQVLSRLECFSQKLTESDFGVEDNVYTDDYFSPENLSIVISSDELEFLKRFKNDKI